MVSGSANPTPKERKHTATPIPAKSPIDPHSPIAPLTWSERLRRVFDEAFSVRDTTIEASLFNRSERGPIEKCEKILVYLGLDEASQAGNRSPPLGL